MEILVAALKDYKIFEKDIYKLQTFKFDCNTIMLQTVSFHYVSLVSYVTVPVENTLHMLRGEM